MILITFYDLFKSVVLPRPAINKFVLIRTAFFESATGVGIAALVITLLFSLYEAFQRREELVVTLDAIAGAPPSGVQILETVAERQMPGKLEETFDEWRAWMAAVLESHLA